MRWNRMINDRKYQMAVIIRTIMMMIMMLITITTRMIVIIKTVTIIKNNIDNKDNNNNNSNEENGSINNMWLWVSSFRGVREERGERFGIKWSGGRGWGMGSPYWSALSHCQLDSAHHHMAGTPTWTTLHPPPVIIALRRRFISGRSF